MGKLILTLTVLILLTAQGIAQKTEIKEAKGGYSLYRDGKPYYIKGAGGYVHLDQLKSCGGNSIRTWSMDNAQQVLDDAQKNGLTVMLGLDIGRERQGFDYNDAEAVKKQLESVKQVVMKYKDHPALLMWAVGNEVEHYATNPKVWNAMHDLVDMIHSVDPNHPTTTILAGVPAQHVKYILERCPNIDILSFNAFKDLPYVPQKIRNAGWKGPYIITEWGSSGYWESDQTKWNISIEATSAEKAQEIKDRYEKSIKDDSKQCIGSYVFFWGQRQERTHTFLSLFLETGERTAAVDMLQYLWTGKWPSNRAPVVSSIRIDDKKAQDNISLAPGSVHTAKASASDPDRETLTYKWELYYESNEKKTGGDKEQKPQMVMGLIEGGQSDEIKFKAPSQEGAYRLFIYVLDGNKGAGTANIPFLVSK